MSGEPFTLLMSVYRGDNAAQFSKAFNSSVCAQTRPPTEVVLVQDGPVDDDLASAIREAVSAAPMSVVLHRLEKNVGLACALTEGLARCTYDIVARMDADDISLPERFERQVPMIEAGLDLVGSGMLEFLDDGGSIVGQRVPRTEPSDIRQYARFHDPFSHPTVVYRRTAVERAGGYQPLGLMEDYWLFARMIASGARVGNVPEPLLMYRVGAGAYRRRGGREQWRSELKLQRAMRSIRFTTRAEYVRNVTVRGMYRFVPEPIRKTIYRRFIAGG